MSSDFYNVQMSTHYEKIILKSFVLFVALARPGTMLPVAREITRIQKIHKSESTRRLFGIIFIRFKIFEILIKNLASNFAFKHMIWLKYTGTFLWLYNHVTYLAVRVDLMSLVLRVKKYQLVLEVLWKEKKINIISISDVVHWLYI